MKKLITLLVLLFTMSLTQAQTAEFNKVIVRTEISLGNSKIIGFTDSIIEGDTLNVPTADAVFNFVGDNNNPETDPIWISDSANYVLKTAINQPTGLEKIGDTSWRLIGETPILKAGYTHLNDLEVAGKIIIPDGTNRNIIIASANTGANISSGANNTAIGMHSLEGLSTGWENAAFGYLTLRSLTTGTSNTGIGNASMYSLLTGSYNTAIGQGALYRNTNGSYNVGLGYLAGERDIGSMNTNASYSVFLGSQTVANSDGETNQIVLGANAIGNGSNTATIGDDNVTDIYFGENGNATIHAANLGLQTETDPVYIAWDKSTGISITESQISDLQTYLVTSDFENANLGLGFNALNGNTTGGSNTAIGYGVLQSSNADNNTGLGNAALWSNTSGIDNTAIGQSAMAFNIDGEKNTAVGKSALYKNTSGYRNTVLGHSALENNTNGHTNISIGYLSGTTVGEESELNGGSTNSIFIGYQTQPENHNQDDQIIIGRSIGKGSHTATFGSSQTTDVWLGQDGTANLHSGNLYVNGDTIYHGLAKIIAGTSEDKQDIFLTTSGGNVYFEVEKIGGGDVEYIFGRGSEYDLDCTTGTGVGGRARIQLTEGTLANEVMNYIYVTHSGGVAQLNSSTVFPTGEFAWCGIALIQSDVEVASDGALLFQRMDESHYGTDLRGQLSKIREKLRFIGAEYVHNGGIAQTLTITEGAPDIINLTTTEGMVFQLHRNTWVATDISTDGIWVANASGLGTLTPNQKITDIGDIREYADGSSIVNNDRVVFTIWGSMNSMGQQKTFINLPTAGHDSDVEALNDNPSYAISTIPENYQTTAFLICKIPLKYNNTGQWINLMGGTVTQDLRGVPTGYNIGGSIVLDPTFAELNDLTAVVVWADVPDLNVTQGAVTQHESALSITESQISDLDHFINADETDPIYTAWDKDYNDLTNKPTIPIGNSIIDWTLTTQGTIHSTNYIDNNTTYTELQLDQDDVSSSDVTTALGYTPYNSTNPNGYITSYTETDPIWSAASSNYYDKTESDTKYFNLGDNNVLTSSFSSLSTAVADGGFLSINTALQADYSQSNLGFQKSNVTGNNESGLMYFGTRQGTSNDNAYIYFDLNNQSTLFSEGGVYFSDARSITKGLEYGGDYSSGFTSKSLINKGYADATYRSYSDNININAITPSKIIDFSSPDIEIYSINSDFSVTTANMSFDRSVIKTIKIMNNTVTDRTLSFPATWQWIGAKPSQLSANTHSILTLQNFSDVNSDVVASFVILTNGE